jgi:protein TonB
VQRRWIPWVAGGSLAVIGILYALMPHSQPGTPPIQTSQPEKKIAAVRKEELPPPSAAGIPAPGAPAGVAASPPSPVRKEERPVAPRRIRVASAVQQALVISQARPVYPPLAIQARIEGIVELNAIIARDGSVLHLTVAKGHPFLVQSALDAAKQWRYQPTLIDGQPVEVQTTIDVGFTLNRK